MAGGNVFVFARQLAAYIFQYVRAVDVRFHPGKSLGTEKIFDVLFYLWDRCGAHALNCSLFWRAEPLERLRVSGSTFHPTKFCSVLFERKSWGSIRGSPECFTTIPGGAK